MPPMHIGHMVVARMAGRYDDPNDHLAMFRIVDYFPRIRFHLIERHNL